MHICGGEGVVHAEDKASAYVRPGRRAAHSQFLQSEHQKIENTTTIDGLFQRGVMVSEAMGV